MLIFQDLKMKTKNKSTNCSLMLLKNVIFLKDNTPIQILFIVVVYSLFLHLISLDRNSINLLLVNYFRKTEYIISSNAKTCFLSLEANHSNLEII